MSEAKKIWGQMGPEWALLIELANLGMKALSQTWSELYEYLRFTVYVRPFLWVSTFLFASSFFIFA